MATRSLPASSSPIYPVAMAAHSTRLSNRLRIGLTALRAKFWVSDFRTAFPNGSERRAYGRFSVRLPARRPAQVQARGTSQKIGIRLLRAAPLNKEARQT